MSDTDICVTTHLVPGGGLGLGSHLKERLHGRAQLWRLRAYQTTGEEKTAFSKKTETEIKGGRLVQADDPGGG